MAVSTVQLRRDRHTLRAVLEHPDFEHAESAVTYELVKASQSAAATRCAKPLAEACGARSRGQRDRHWLSHSPW